MARKLTGRLVSGRSVNGPEGEAGKPGLYPVAAAESCDFEEVYWCG